MWLPDALRQVCSGRQPRQQRSGTRRAFLCTQARRPSRMRKVEDVNDNRRNEYLLSNRAVWGCCSRSKGGCLHSGDPASELLLDQGDWLPRAVPKVRGRQHGVRRFCKSSEHRHRHRQMGISVGTVTAKTAEVRRGDPVYCVFVHLVFMLFTDAIYSSALSSTSRRCR